MPQKVVCPAIAMSSGASSIIVGLGDKLHFVSL